MNDEQHFDSVVNLVYVHSDLLDGEIVFQFGDQRPWFLTLLSHARHHGIGGHAEDRQRGHDTDNRFFVCLNPGDSPRELVFEKPLFVWRKERNSLLFVHPLAYSEAEIKLFTIREL